MSHDGRADIRKSVAISGSPVVFGIRIGTWQRQEVRIAVVWTDVGWHPPVTWELPSLNRPDSLESSGNAAGGREKKHPRGYKIHPIDIIERVRCRYSPPDPNFLMNSKLSREICSSGAPRSANSEMERKETVRENRHVIGRVLRRTRRYTV